MGSRTTVNFNDTSEYMYRNSSTKRGGFEGEIGFVSTNTNLDIAGTEDIRRDTDLLTQAERDRVSNMIGHLTTCTTEALCAEKADLKTRANQAWDRAWSLYPTYRTELDAQLDDLKEDTINRICLWESQWARTAGSSLNCLVQSLKNRAEVELARRIAGIIAETNMRMKEHETQAIAEAFSDGLEARMEPTKVAFNQIASLYSILRGARMEEVTDRDYTEDRDESQRRFTAMGKFYHEAISIADNSGAYAGDVDNAVSAANNIAGLVPTA